jgi:hypothetical protein
MKTLMFGYSDDNVEFRGNIRDEVSSWDTGQIVVFSNGLTAYINYAPQEKAIWKITVVSSYGKFEIKHIGEDDTEKIEEEYVSYSDCLIIEDEIDWCICFDTSRYNLIEVAQWMRKFEKIEKITKEMVKNWYEKFVSYLCKKEV